MILFQNMPRQDFLFQRYGKIEVSYRPHLDGGGRHFGQFMIPTVKNLVGRVGRAFEFCAGPGFIGFSLLAQGLCDTLCLADVNPEAVNALKDTVRRNRLGDRVTVYLSDGLGKIPSHEKWDLVVGNPPFYRAATQEKYKTNIRTFDPLWSIHHRFFQSVACHMNPGSSIFLMETYEGSVEDDFLPLIENSGLHFRDSFMYKARVSLPFRNHFYQMWLQTKGGPLARSSRRWTNAKTRDKFIWSGEKSYLLDLKASQLGPLFEAEAPAWKKCELSVLNDRDSHLTLALESDLERPLVAKEGLDVPVAAKNRGRPFYCTPGRYKIVELHSRKILGHVVFKKCISRRGCKSAW